MVRMIGLWLVGCALCINPVAADEDVYDGPTAIKPLTVTPKPPQPAAPTADCDFEHHCYSDKGGPAVTAPVAPPAVATKPVAPRPTVPDDPVVAAWRECMAQALQNYEQSHNLRALQRGTGSCQIQLGAQGDENLAGAEPPMSLMAPARLGGRRNIGCGWWPVGSDADRDCAGGGRRF